MFAVQTRPDGQKVNCRVFKFTATNNTRFAKYIGDICVVGRNADGTGNIRLLANYDEIITTKIVKNVREKNKFKLYTENSVYEFEQI